MAREVKELFDAAFELGLPSTLVEDAFRAGGQAGVEELLAITARARARKAPAEPEPEPEEVKEDA